MNNLKERKKKVEKTGKLSMSLIERMIKSEQRNSLFFGDKLKCKETKYYQKLCCNEKREFDKYRGLKRLRKGLFVFGLFVLGLTFVLMNTQFTGNVVAEFVEDEFSLFSDMFIFCIGGAFLVMLVVYMMKEKWAARLERDFGIIDEIYLDKSVAERG